MPQTFGEMLRIAIIVAVLVLLIRAARMAWGRRRLALRIWKAVRPRHVIGSVGLMVIVLGVALTLLILLPVTGVGLGRVVGLEGSAVFAPIDNALEAPLDAAVQAEETGEAAPGVPWTDVASVTVFLGGLVLLFPHLAHSEEAAFRAGWEDLNGRQQVFSALRFGMIHLIMLIPLAAALAVGVAGYVYGRIYLRSYGRNAIPRLTIPVGAGPRLAEDDQGLTRLVMGPPSPEYTVDRVEARRQAVFDAAVWHTAFNTTVAVLVWAGYVLSL